MILKAAANYSASALTHSASKCAAGGSARRKSGETEHVTPAEVERYRRESLGRIPAQLAKASDQQSN
jgi:hypothetical protein